MLDVYDSSGWQSGALIAGVLGRMISLFRLLTVSTVVVLAGTALPVAAQQQAASVAARAATKAAVRATALATINGNAFNSVNGALPNIMVRLRDVKFGRIVGSSLTDHLGAYSFKGLDPGNYIVEIVSTDQTSIAATNLISANAGDTVNSVVRLPFKATMLANMLGGQVSPAIGGGSGGGSITSQLEDGLMQIALQGLAAVVPAGTPISER
jgi:hypothetical protein